MPAGILSRLIDYANCNRCELTPDDSRFLAGVMQEITRAGTPVAVSAKLESDK
jgi:hypothetical protein